MEVKNQPRKHGLAIALAASLSLTLGVTSAWAKPNGKPFQEIDAALQALNERVTELEISLDNLEEEPESITESVNCDNGDSIGAALNQHSHVYTPLTIEITGHCDERVVITRDNVTLQGAAPGAGLYNSVADTWTLAISRGASNTLIQDLTVSQGRGLVVSKNAEVELNNVVVTEASTGTVAANGGYLGITGSHIHNNAYGVLTTNNGTARVDNSIIEYNDVGLLAFKGSTIALTSALPNDAPGQGVQVQHNTNGAVVYTGATLDLVDAQFEFNTSTGVFLRALGTLHLSPSLNGQGTTINNQNLGIYAIKGTTLFLSDELSEISNNQIGIYCLDDPTYIVDNGPTGPGGLPSTMVGNAAGNVVGCAP